MNGRCQFRAAALAASIVTLAGSSITLASGIPGYESRSFSGIGNNLANPAWGMTNTQLLRESSGAHYADGVSSFAGATRPGAREVSNAFFAQPIYMPNERGMSGMLWQWGQFLDHDIDLTPDNGDSTTIAVPAGDPDFDPGNTGTITMGLHRSQHDPSTGTSTANPRQQVNVITAYIDGSAVYGSDDVRAANLREFTGGRLKVTPNAAGDLLPFNTVGEENAGGDGNTSLFLAGDIRCNEQIGLTAMHTLFVREHNYWADRLASENPAWNDETIFEAARKIVGAEMQIITYSEFLPALLGSYAPGAYTGYDPNTDASISNAFNTAAYRFGHTMLNESLMRINADFTEAPEGHVMLRDAFFNPPQIINNNIDTLIRGLVYQVCNTIDCRVINDVRNMLFMNFNGPVPLDLVTLNIQRGRDHGLADYNTLRDDYAMAKVTSFAQITSNPADAATLQSVYGNVDNIDPWVGMLAEDHLFDAAVGETLVTVMHDQFERIRKGDRFYYANDPFITDQPALMMELESTRLSDIIARNTNIDRETLPDNAFFVCTLSGDADRSGQVTINDLNLVLANWGDPNVPPGTRGDCDGDGNINVDDLNKVLANWDQTCGG